MESKGHCSILKRVLSEMGRSILPFFSSVVDSCLFFGLNTVSVPPPCARAKFTPCVDVAGLGNEKLKLHVRRRRAPPLSLFACKRGQKRKKNSIVSLYNDTDTVSHRGGGGSCTGLTHLSSCLIPASAACSNCSCYIKTQLLLHFLLLDKETWAPLSPRCFHHQTQSSYRVVDMINT